MEWESFVGQKKRLNQLGPVDREITSGRKRNADRAQRFENRKAKMHLHVDVALTSYQCPGDINEDICDSCDNDDDGIDFVPDNELRGNQQNRFTYENQVIIADRYQVSCRAAAAIVNAALKDMEILNDTNMFDKKRVE
ncbi:Hypothetical predicted protein [Octopus vulgaris]|uniref:Uncharacterized protein n=1 Tax=Octopus vulgaris TaxID=6645 RepID=A0AA36EZU5_OCTVU|nr:Hypothetical predicted protein [Octopus vulgaris]